MQIAPIGGSANSGSLQNKYASRTASYTAAASRTTAAIRGK